MASAISKRHGICLQDEFTRFIIFSKNGKRRKPDGERIKKSTIDIYHAVFNHLIAFKNHEKVELILPICLSKSKREISKSINFWNKLFTKYHKYLIQLNCRDNYISLHFKTIYTFLNWLVNERHYSLVGFKQKRIRCNEKIPVIVLNQSQINTLLTDEFRKRLSPKLLETVDLFLFGCYTGLRYSDLENLKKNNLFRQDSNIYLRTISLKTQTETMTKLPESALKIIELHKQKRRLLPYPSLAEFNKRLKLVGEAANWTWEVNKYRQKDGRYVEVKTKYNKPYRFCDLLSSHIMRRTAITTLLMNGVPEHVVRKVSGHSVNSSEFFRYVQYTQNFVDDYTDNVWNKFNLPTDYQ